MQQSSLKFTVGKLSCTLSKSCHSLKSGTIFVMFCDSEERSVSWPLHSKV